MTPFLQLALALALIIAAAKIFGYLSLKIGQPSVLGELLIGVIIGPSVLNILALPYFTDEHLPEVIHQMAEIGVMLLMFIAGIELHLKDLVKSRAVSAYAGTLGVVFPLLLGTGAGLLFGESLPSAIFIGLILSATSVSISAQTLMELNVLRSRVGIGMLGAAVFDDILVVLMLSIFVAVSDPNVETGWLNVLIIVLRMAAYLLVAMGVGFWLLPRLSRKISRLPISQGLVAFTLVILLLYGWTAEELGNMAAITGAFLAGLIFARSPVKNEIEQGISAVAFGLFVPVFFVNVGLSANVRELGGESLLLMVVMVVVAVIGKIIGAGAGGRIAGFSWLESLQLGVGMVSRGEVGLIVASVGISSGLVTQPVFSAVVGVVIVTTLLTPPLLRLSFQKKKPKSNGKSPIIESEES